MLRVAHVINSPGRGGVPRVVHALMRHTDPDRIAPHLFYLKGGAGPDLFEDADLPRRTARSASKATAMTELVAFLDQHRIDILHTHSFRPNLYARMAGAVLRPSGLRTVAHYHNYYSDKWSGAALLLERRLTGVTDAGLAVSGAVAEHVADRVGLACDVVENGIDWNRVTGGCRSRGRATLGLASDDVVIGLIGRVCRQKGIDTFVEAACRLLPLGPVARFLIIGDAEDRMLVTRLTTRIREAGFEDFVRFVGHREDIADVLAALDILSVPSRWEGFGLTLAEAMAAGVPVIASDVGGIPEVVGQAAFLVPADDPDALAAAIGALARNPARLAALCAAGVAEAQRFDWALAAEKVAALYSRIGAR